MHLVLGGLGWCWTSATKGGRTVAWPCGPADEKAVGGKGIPLGPSSTGALTYSSYSLHPPPTEM